MKLRFIVFVSLVMMLLACSKDREAPNGRKVRVFREGTGTFAKPGEFLITSMVVKDAKDSVWRDTREHDLPMIIPVGDESAITKETGVESAFRVMKLNDSCAVDIDAKTLFRDQPLPPGVKPEDLITFTFSVKDITNQAGVAKIQQQLQARQVAEANKEVEAQVMRDAEAIDAYLAAKGIVATKDSTGLRYVIKKLGNGPKPIMTSILTVKYRGTFMDSGKEFDHNDRLEYPLARFIEGWKVGFQMLPKGSVATLYVPSGMAYGANGYPPDIPPNANLVFEVELLDFK
jgi:FKBP-type peptidyl-prolyl cis-trans isomerase FkpA